MADDIWLKAVGNNIKHIFPIYIRFPPFRRSGRFFPEASHFVLQEQYRLKSNYLTVNSMLLDTGEHRKHNVT